MEKSKLNFKSVGHFCFSPTHGPSSILIVFLSSLCILSNVHVTSGQDCQPKDCIASQWAEWSSCSESCGDSGVRTRTRTLLLKEECGGKCQDGTSQEEECNRKCCPRNCVFTDWTGWSSCQCHSDRCAGYGSWSICYRFRKKTQAEDCGGYCDQRTYEMKCIRPCCYKDCVLGGWQPWGPCEARCESPGLSTRERVLIQEPGCGGKRCVGGEEKRACQGSCCPVDCVLGVWSEWSLCPAVCGQANQTRTRFISEPICGGAECNDTRTTDTKTCEVFNNEDCKVSPWSEWSQCTLDNGLCGQGKKTRSRKVIIEPECRGLACPNTTEPSVCFGQCCRADCQVGDWSDFGHCSADCGTGIATRTREVIVQPDCGGTECPALSEGRDCEVASKTDCEFTEWTAWSNCNNDCGQGKQSRSRTLLTPAYCGGQCVDEDTDQEKDCESYSAKTDCKVSEWSPWGECVRDCDQGMQESSRTILDNDQCGGIPCEGTYNLTRTQTCHDRCSQRCNQGVCSCDTGYVLQDDGFTCEKVRCVGTPKLSYCAPGTRAFESCMIVLFNCQANRYEDKCNGACMDDFVLKGTPEYSVCQADGQWAKPKLYCGLKNLPPKDMDISSTVISELTRKGQCFATLATETTNESWDVHKYSIQDDPSGILDVDVNQVCVKSTLDFENARYTEWEAALRTTDIDGLFLDKSFTFTLKNENDPPRAATLHPSTVPENSPRGTAIGCFTVIDDDEGQTVTMVMLSNEDFFKLQAMDNGSYCLVVNAESDPDCLKYGGQLCKLNFEEKSEYFIAIMVTDDAPISGEAYFEIRVQLTDINEPVTGIILSSQSVEENVEPGQPLMMLTAEDEDKGTEHQFEILNDPSGLFSIDGDSLTASKSFDYEGSLQEEFTLTIKVTDPNPPTSSIEKSVTFGIQDVNEVPYNLGLSNVNSLETFPRNKPKAKENIENLKIGTVSVIDPDRGDSIDFSVNDTSFTINRKHCSSTLQGVYQYCSGELMHHGVFDFEAEPFVYISITAKDSSQTKISEEFEIEIIDIDDPPTDILIDGNEANNISLPENAQDVQIAVIEAVDEDKEDEHTFFLSGQASSFFVIQDNVIKTREGAAFDFEAYEPVFLTITTIDKGGASFSKKFEIVVIDVNEPPTIINFSDDTVSENSEEGTLVSTLSAIDPDNASGNQQSFIYELLDDAEGRFDIEDNQLLVKKSDKTCGKSLCSLDYEGQREILVQVKVTDNGQPPQSEVASKVIRILNANDAPQSARISSNQVRENKIAGSVIGVLTAFDQDADDTLTFTLMNHTDEFEILEGNQLVQRGVLDFEEKNEYFIQVQVEDSGIPVGVLTETITIEVTDANEKPEFVGPDEYNVFENETLQSVITILSVLDPDKKESVKLRLKNFQDNFMIGDISSSDQEEQGTLFKAELLTNSFLDYERQTTFDVGLIMTDRDGLEALHQIRLNIQDTNDLPENILLNGSPNPEISVDEGTTGDIGDFTAVDQDSGQLHAFRIKSQPGNELAVSGSKLQVSSSLDAEASSSIVITVEVTDNGIPTASFEKNFTIIVTNVNEPPSALTLLNSEIAENSVDGTEVGLLLPQDPDSSGGYDFVLMDNADGKFRIEGIKIVVVASGKCTANAQAFCSLNFEKEQTHTVKVIVTDHDFPPQSATFDLEINVTDDNDSPTDIELSDSSVEELAEAGTVIGTLSVTDEDVGQTHAFTITENTDGAFEIGKDGISLVKATSERLKTSQVYSVTIAATDSGEPPKSVEKKFFIGVSGVSEAPNGLKLVATQGNTLVDETRLKVPENMALEAVAEIFANDNDLDQTISFSLLENPDEMFGLDDNVACEVLADTVTCVGHLILQKSLNFEQQTKYSVTILATDSNSETSSQSFTIEVTDVPEAPTDIIFSKERLTVFENSEDTIVGKFSSVDEDEDDSHTFSLSSDGDGKMSVDSSGTLSVQKGADIDYEASRTFNITVLVEDSAGNQFDKSFSVEVLNVNERPVSLSLSQDSIAEGSTANTVVGQLSTVDLDNENPGENILQSFQYLLKDDAEGRFYLDGSSVVLSPKGAQCEDAWCGLNFEENSVHKIQVQVTDSGTPALSATFSLDVRVSDENDVPLLLDIGVSQLKEDMDIGDEVALLSATDEDEGQQLVFSIIDKENSLFAIEDQSIILNGKLDFEATKTVSVGISVTDNGSPPQSAERTYSFDVLNVEEKPSSIHFESIRGSQAEIFPADKPVIKENMDVGSLVGQLIVTDPDMDEKITVIITGDEIQAENTGCLILTRGTRCVSILLLKRTLDYEKEKEFSVTISAIDNTGNELTKDFQIHVKDENDPVQEILINNEDINTIEVSENEVDRPIADLTVVDEDFNQTFNLEVKGSSQFYIVSNELRIGSAAQLDYERFKEISLRIKATDDGLPSLSLEKDIIVKILDVNEAPLKTSLTRNKVSEDSPEGTEIGNFVTSDPDNQVELRQTFKYELIEDIDELFRIEGSDLKVQKAAFDFEEKTKHSIKVRVTDSGSPPLSSEFAFEIVVLDRNDPPSNIQLSGFTVQENADLNTEIGKLSAEDPDKDQALSFLVLNSEHVTVVNETLVANGRLDFEKEQHFQIEVVASDDAIPPKSISKAFTITVTDTNEAPYKLMFTPASASGGMEIDERTKPNELIGVIKSYDVDKIDRAIFTMTQLSSPIFKLDNSEANCTYHLVSSMGSNYTECWTNVYLAEQIQYNARNPTLTLEVSVADKGTLALKSKWEISVLDVNDPPYNITIKDDRHRVPENRGFFQLGAVECIDHDIGQTFIFQVLTHWDIFKISQDSILSSTKKLDAEEQSEYELTLRCSDSGVPEGSFEKTFVINVEDVNEAPIDITLSHDQVPMTAQDGQNVAFISVIDPDNEGTVTDKQKHFCNLTKDASQSFELNDDTKTLLVKGSVPVKNESVTITIQCLDDGVPPLSFSKMFKLIITETADVPKEIVLQGNAKLDENSENVEIGTFTIINQLTESEIQGTFVYENLEIEETTNDVLSVRGNNLYVEKAVDFETTPKLSGSIQAKGKDANDNDIEVKGTFELTIVDINEKPSQILIYGGGNVKENLPEGTIIGKLNTIDPEPYQQYSYKLMSVAIGLDVGKADPSLLDVIALEGATLRTGPLHTVLDYETNQTLSAVIQTTDSGSPPLSLNYTVRIVVQDTNDVPVNITLDSYTIKENSALETRVGRLQVEDPDEDQHHSCVINNLQDVPFNVKDWLDLVVSKKELDFEGQRTYVVDLTCEDTGLEGNHLKVSKALTVHVLDENEPPYNISLSKLDVEEDNSVGDFIAQLSATDPDSTQIFFSLEEDVDDFFIKGKNTLVAGSVFDFEKQSSYTVTVSARDDGGLSSKETFSIQVIDKNEKPTSITITNTVVSENAEKGTLVGFVRTEDPDQKQSFKYTLSDLLSANGQFVILGDRLEVGSGKLDYEAGGVHRISITSQDNGQPPQTFTAEFDITVEDENEAPTEIIIQEPVTVEENTKTQTVLREITVEDEEPEQAHFCSILTTQVPFSIIRTDSGAIHLIVSGVVNFEEKSSYDLNISCSDGEYDIYKTLKIQVTNVNEAPTSLVLKGPQALPATVTENYEVGILIAEDEDKGQDHIFTVTGPNSDLFRINGDRLIQIDDIPSDILGLTKVEVNITLTVIDSGLIFRQIITLPISDEDLNGLKLPEFNLNNLKIMEDAEQGDVVAQITTRINQTLGDHINFFVLEDPQTMFSIKGTDVILSKGISSVIVNSADVRIEAVSHVTQESQDRSFTFVIERSDKCYKDGKTCHEEARCLKLNSTDHDCQCKEDFRGNGYSCEQIDDCLGNEAECGSHGECVDDVNSFNCKCQNGYTGPSCEIAPPVNDSCTSNECQNMAVCELDESEQGYKCNCAPGWEGQRCEQSVDDCEPNACGSNGLCIDEHLSYSCNCSETRTGHRCQYFKGTCTSGSCGNGDVCIPKPNELDSFCVPASSSASLLAKCEGDDNLQQCANRLLHFLEKNGIFSIDNQRQEFFVFLSSVTGGSESSNLVDFFILTKDFVALNEGQILESLSETCKSIDSSNQESVYCPAIMEAFLEYKFRNVPTAPAVGGEETTKPVVNAGTTRSPEVATIPSKASSVFSTTVLMVQFLVVILHVLL